jgi:GntR family transcriptional regulator, arabinose operon transcriptional repressor
MQGVLIRNGEPVTPTRTTSRRTKYGDLTRTLTELAESLQPGDRFPTQAELMRRYQVSDRTLLRSLDDLQRAGWIVRRHGSGTFVADPRERQAAAGDTAPPLLAAPAESRVIAALALTISPSRFYYQHCIDLLSAQAEVSGLSLVCHHARSENAYEDALPLEALRPRGFVVFNYTLEPIARQLLERGHRVVIAGTPPADVYPAVPCVYGDHEQGGYMATRHLLELGHRRIAFARTTSQPTSLLRSIRWQGHQRALREAMQSGQEIAATLLGSETLDAWRRDPALAAQYFARRDAPTGIVAWNDSEATSLLGLLHSVGVSVPEDVSIIGYDALPESQQSLPPLTTIDQHVDRQMRAALDLLTRPAPPPPTQSIVVLPTLVRRASCAAAAAATAAASHPISG